MRAIARAILVREWLDNDLKTLWAMAKNRANDLSSTKGHLTSNNTKQTVSLAVSLGQAGLLGKACQILLSNGTAPITDTTLHLLQDKHPSCPVPLSPVFSSEPVTLSPSFDILHILRSFPKGTSAGPSGYSMQHLLDAASVPLLTNLCHPTRSC